ncbi:hypothetical protein [Leptospira bandrabouensis]|uniref:hypothetical protein n=1 Tax=Leptospira bandrabouensis TaxID=2484903 RepID=UPI001EE923C6|nr:hypothetical protein [Leptospira bandrabouensis]MCG6146559.1 hypothetical protein [Leptospira bandrabouensis]MCG6162007.1 hypothetical protein [Leptospira bandrabouensis]MCG6166216.1 hypothetical protein [Leptospira bandrabouensis]
MTVTQSIILAFIALLSINSYYITFTNILGFLNIALLAVISITIFTFPKGNLEFHQKTLLFLSPLFLLNGNFTNIYFISTLLSLHTISILKFRFKNYEIFLEIIFITILILFIFLFFCFKNKNNHIEEIDIFSQNKEHILKKKYIDEGGLGASQYLILIKNHNSLMKQEIELCYNSNLDELKWIDNEEIKITEFTLGIKKINFILKRPNSGKCLTNLSSN